MARSSDGAASTLNIGAFGPDVTELQRALQRLGYSTASSEVQRAFFGPVTRRMVQAFQQQNDITPNGRIDQLTAAIIDAALSTSISRQDTSPVAVEPSPPAGSASLEVGGGTTVIVTSKRSQPTSIPVKADSPSAPGSNEEATTVQVELSPVDVSHPLVENDVCSAAYDRFKAVTLWRRKWNFL